MDWENLGSKLLGGGLPLLGSLIGGPAGAAVGTLIASALGVKDTPEAVAQALNDPQAMIKLRELELNHEKDLQQMYLVAESTNLLAVNETYRSEIASSDWYVRRMRPTFGYLVALTLTLQVSMGCYVVGWEPIAMPAYATFITALNVPMGAALAVLGVYVNGRTKEKAMDAGVVPSEGLVSRIMNRMGV